MERGNEKKTKKKGVIKMRKILSGISLLVLCLGLAGIGYAATTADVNVRVSITGTALSVAVINPGTTTYTWDAGGNAAGTWTVNTSSISVINDSGGLTEKYKLNATDATRSGGTTWTLADTLGVNNQYAMRARLNGSTQPNNDDTDFSVADHNLTTAPVDCTASKFAGTEAGASVPDGEYRGLWIRVGRPTSTVDPAEHQATLVITAATP